MSNNFGAKDGELEQSPGLGDSASEEDQEDQAKDVFQAQFEQLLQKVGNKYISNKSKLDSERHGLREIQNVPIKANVNDTILASEKSGGRPKKKKSVVPFKTR